MQFTWPAISVPLSQELICYFWQCGQGVLLPEHVWHQQWSKGTLKCQRAILVASVHLQLFHWVWSNGKQNILIIASHNSLAELSSVCSDQHNSFRAAAGPGICWLHHSLSNIGNNCFSHLLNVSNLKNVFILHWDESKICSCKNLSSI